MSQAKEQHDRAARMALNQATFRTANHGIAHKAIDVDLSDAPLPFVCECSDPGCTQLARLTLREYEEVRGKPNQFLVVPGHDGRVEEPALKATDRYVMVAKQGVAGRLAADLQARDDTT